MDEIMVNNSVVQGDIIIYADRKCAIYIFGDLCKGEIKIKKGGDFKKEFYKVLKRYEKGGM